LNWSLPGLLRYQKYIAEQLISTGFPVSGASREAEREIDDATRRASVARFTLGGHGRPGRFAAGERRSITSVWV
jgi:hypothetical protein